MSPLPCQMIDDVRLCAAGSRRHEFLRTADGFVPAPEEVAAKIKELL